MNDPDIQLWCEDEVYFQRHSSLTLMWAPKGQQHRVLSASTRQKVGFFGALNLKTGCLLTKEASTFNAVTFGDFLSYVFQRTEGKIHLILDNASWHKAVDLRDFFINNPDHLVRIFLLLYSPDLNFIERVWRVTRRQVTHNRYFALTEELTTALTSYFARWEQPNNTLKTLCVNM